MSQKAVELILMRQLASSLAMPIFLVDAAGNLVFYNEPAEQLLGSRYDETGEMSVGEWSSLFAAIGEDGSPLPGEALPLSIALHKHRAAHLAFWIRGLDGVSRKIGATAFPLDGQGGRRLGAVGIFWEERLT
ncbi:MAG: PAS domain-containing protein [Gemmatimonadales bacterium]|jgi:PAS domain-containing protein